MPIQQATIIRLLYFFAFACQGAWLPRFAEYLQSKNIEGWQMATILSLTPLLMFLVQPMYGALADRIGYKKSLLLSTAVAACSYALYPMGESFYYFAGITIIMSISFNAVMPTIDSMALNLADRDASFSYGTLRIAGAMGWSVMGLMSGYLIQQYALISTFYIAGVAMVLACIIALLLPSTMDKETITSRSREENTITSILKNRSLIIFLCLIALVSVFMTAIWNFYSMYMTEIKASASVTGMGLALQGVCELPFFYFAAVIIGRLKLKPTLILTLIVTMLRMICYSVVTDPYLALGIELVHGISWSLFWVVCVEITDTLVDNSKKATGQSLLYASYFGIGTIAGNYWTAYLIKQMTLGKVFLINAALLGVAAILVYFMKMKHSLPLSSFQAK